MTEVDTTGWPLVGSTSNTQYFRYSDRILVALPLPGVMDTRATALENRDFQRSWFEQSGTPGTVVVFFDRMKGQDSDARKVYASGVDRRWLAGSALVGGSMLGRAMASFFLGLTRPTVPTKMFGTLEEAVRWAQDRNTAVLDQAV